MGDNCVYLQRDVLTRTERRRRTLPTTIAAPNAGDVLRTRTTREGVKGLICLARNIIACLSPGDRVSIGWNRRNNRWLSFGLQQPRAEAEFFYADVKDDIRDRFRFPNGRVITMEQLNRKMSMVVVSVVPRDHVHEPAPEYSDDAVRKLLDRTSLPAPTATDSHSRCGARELVSV
jgi:hypothetical protein